MADIIRLLPDSVANQIAAGEVIQRPASVIKELVENAVDAGATDIKIVVKDAGKTLIQVTDNGCGMSATDARMAFERHATSKIKNADDLFCLHTKGFRGEALASIAAIAHVELRTRMAGHEVGQLLEIEGSKYTRQEAVACPVGSTFSVRNLFYNTPARRKFLKGETAELRHILTEVQRVALVHPGIGFLFVHNDNELLRLPATNLRQRIVGTFGKAINKELIPIETQTSVVRITGFVGSPEEAKKRSGDQYFFVNNRYFRSSYFHRAVMNGYHNILAPSMYPTYFIYLEVDPEQIDVNIHPTKTEIKFAHGETIFQILEVVVREGLGRINVVPSIDFGERVIDIPVGRPTEPITEPSLGYDPSYNPFDETPTPRHTHSGGNWQSANAQGWEKFYDSFDQDQFEPEQFAQPEAQQASFDLPQAAASPATTGAENFFQYKNRYIFTTVKSGLMVIDQRRAHERILYEYFVTSLRSGQRPSQQSLFPQALQLPPDHAVVLRQLQPSLAELGFALHEAAPNQFQIAGIPAELTHTKADELLASIIEHYNTTPTTAELQLRERTALALARSAAIEAGRSLAPAEMQALIGQLFACQAPNYTPDGRTIIVTLDHGDIERRFH